jgi:hypothetical protein
MMPGVGVGEQQPGRRDRLAADPERVHLPSPPVEERAGLHQGQSWLALRSCGDLRGRGIRGAVVDHQDERLGRLDQQGVEAKQSVMFFVTDGEQNRCVVKAGMGRRERWSAPPPPADPESESDEATADQDGGGERRVHRLAGRDSLFESGLDLPGQGKAACLFLGEQELVVDGHLEDSTGPFDELGLDAELLFDLLRQTGGAGEVVSDPAILDDDACGHDRLLSRGIIPPSPLPFLGRMLLFKT